MESAALEAYRKDIESNADLTSIAINKKVKDENLTITGSKKLWQETKSPSGKTYYWNTLTNQSLWEPPSEGYLSIAEQKDVQLQQAKNQIKAIQKHDFLQEKLRVQEHKMDEEEERARLAREKMKERRGEDIPIVVAAPIIPSGKTEPYGQWKTIKESVPLVDLQLPIRQEYEMPVIEEVEPEPVRKEFKEKVVESLGNGSVGFKRRRAGTANRRNARQRLDDE